MRLIGALWILAFSLSGIGLASASYDPDCVVVYGTSGPTCVSRASAPRKAAAKQDRQQKIVSRPKVAPVFGAQPHVAEAQRWVGATAAQMGVRRTLWCAAGLNKWLRHVGLPETKSDAAGSFLTYGRAVSGPQVGAIVVTTWRRDRQPSHVGIVTGVADNGDPIVISANHNNRVAVGQYAQGTVLAYRMP